MFQRVFIQNLYSKYAQGIKLQGSLIICFFTNNRLIIFTFSTEIYNKEKKVAEIIVFVLCGRA